MKTNRFPARIAAALCAAVLGCTALTACAGGNTSSSEDEKPAQTKASETEETETEAEEETEAETAHISPTETITTSLGTQIDVDAVLNRDSDEDKNYKTALSNFIGDGDMVDSFTFIFYSGDGTSNIGTYKGGCGISVTGDCAAATDEGWYQSDDFSVQAEGSYVEVKWDVPSEIRPYITAGGEVQIGYWWGNTTTVNLKNIICSYTHTAELPVDGTQTVTVNKSLNFSSDTTNSVTVPLGDVLGEDGIPQAIIFAVSAGAGFGKFTGAFGITTDPWYQSDTVAVMTDSTNLNLTWILPDSVKRSIPQNADVMLGYWWGEVSDITLQSITVKYSNGLGTGELYTPPTKKNNDSTGNDNSEEEKPVISSTNNTQAAEIAAAIKVGWCLGNSLDCYDKKNISKDMETYWGNVKTTKATIDTIKAKGFNAVRIPVSWTNHLDSSSTIDSAWMDRVQEVVDYAMDNDLYVILNMHHDDYVWLHPVYAEENEVTAKYVRIWEQIADRFKDYDTKLLFEGLNEPRVVGSSAEWTGGTEEEHDVINHLLQKFVNTVRASGSNNETRTLVVTTHAASITDPAVNGLVLPDDKNIIVSIHNYAPWKFTTTEFPDARTFDDDAKDELNSEFDKLYNKFVSKGVPVIIGEFGAEDKSNTSDRAAYYSYYITAAAQRGIPCFIWDNGGSDSYGLLNRSKNEWYYPEIVDAIANAAK